MSPFRIARARFGSPTAFALYTGLLLLPAVSFGLVLNDLMHEAEPRWLLSIASFLPLAIVIAERNFPRFQQRHGHGESLKQEEDILTALGESGESAETGIACPVDQPACWVIDALQTHLRASGDISSYSEGSGVASRIAQRACELMDAQAAWLFRTTESGGGISVASNYIRVADAVARIRMTNLAWQLAEKLLISAARHDMRGGQSSQIVAEGGYLAVLLACRHRILGVMVVLESAATAGSQLLRGELLLSLARQATLSLENALLHEAQLDVETKLRQLALHRTDYVATLSHELRTPLTSIKGFAQLMMREDGVPARTTRQYAGTIVAEADKLALIVSDIVDLTRMETGLLELRRQPVSLGRLMRTVVQRLQPMAPPLKLSISVPQQLPLVRGDPDRLDQVFGRLLVDAIGQAPPGSTILLAAEAGDDGATVRLEYTTTEDQIVGLSEALKGLNSFSSDGQATKLGRGRLGLYICRNYIEAHGGKMWVECPEEQMARVVFTLPY